MDLVSRQDVLGAPSRVRLLPAMGVMDWKPPGRRSPFPQTEGEQEDDEALDMEQEPKVMSIELDEGTRKPRPMNITR